MHVAGYFIGLILVIVGIGQAITRGWIIDGWFLLLAGVGVLIFWLAKVAMDSYNDSLTDRECAVADVDLERKGL